MKKIKTRMTKDEWYPFYIPTQYEHHKEVKVEAKDLKDYNKAVDTLGRIFSKWDKLYKDA